jgi:hypothetical protein
MRESYRLRRSWVAVERHRDRKRARVAPKPKETAKHSRVAIVRGGKRVKHVLTRSVAGLCTKSGAIRDADNVHEHSPIIDGCAIGATRYRRREKRSAEPTTNEPSDHWQLNNFTPG